MRRRVATGEKAAKKARPKSKKPRRKTKGEGNRLIACDLANPNFVEMAKSFGMGAVRAGTPGELAQALPEALTTN
ncbi:MAG: hypothetical protein WCG92_17905 [Hyphomicrobiales bacterium]